MGHPDDSLGRQLTVMVADDDPVARELICQIILEDEMLHLVGVAENADAAVDLVEDQHPDVAVLDWMMPGGGGPEASRGIVEKSPGTQIVALTAFDTQRATADMLRAGAKSVSRPRASPPAEIARTHLRAWPPGYERPRLLRPAHDGDGGR